MKEEQNIIQKEKQILAILINSQMARNEVILRLKKDDFLDSKNQIIFENIEELHRTKKKTFDIVLFVDVLRLKNILKQAGGVDYVSEINDLYVSDELLEDYFIALLNDSVKRKFLSMLKDMSLNAQKEYQGKNLIKMFDKNIQNLNEFLERKEQTIINIEEILGEDLLDKDNFLKANRGCFSGFHGLDSRLMGFKKGELIIMAARPSMGKTALALNIAFNVARSSKIDINKKDIIFFSLEMSTQQLAYRILTSQLGDYRKSNKKALYDLKKELSELNIFINKDSGLSVWDIYNQIKERVKKRGVKLIIIDYLQLLKSIQKRNYENRNLEVGTWTRKLKEMALEFGVPIICLSQLSRNVEKREEKRPFLSDLRDSGSIEQDADVVFFLYRDSYYKQSDPDLEEANSSPLKQTEIIISKNRNGPVGTAFFLFNTKTLLFFEYKE